MKIERDRVNAETRKIMKAQMSDGVNTVFNVGQNGA